MATAPPGAGKPPEEPAGVPYGPWLEEMFPCDGQDAAGLVGAVVTELATFWSPLGLPDASAALSSLGFVINEAERLLWGPVADARELGYSWEEIARHLGRATPEVEERYAIYAKYADRRTSRAQRQVHPSPPPGPAQEGK
ncbi:MAG: hypothetical protein ACRDZX_14530 [Acidimicrobiales bacterium]